MSKPKTKYILYGVWIVLVVSLVGHAWRARTPRAKTPPAAAPVFSACLQAPWCDCPKAAGDAKISAAIEEKKHAPEDAVLQYWVEGIRRNETSVWAQVCELSQPELARNPSVEEMKQLCEIPRDVRALNVGLPALEAACNEHDGNSCVLLAISVEKTKAERVRFAEQACSEGSALGCVLTGNYKDEPAWAQKACDLGRDEPGSGSRGCGLTGRNLLKKNPQQAFLFFAKACYRGIRSPRDDNRQEGPGYCRRIREAIEEGTLQLDP